MRRLAAIALPYLLVACGSGQSEPEADPAQDVPERCRAVHVDKLDKTDWVGIKGSAADPKTRMRVVAKGGHYEAYYINGFFKKLKMKGIKRDTDVQFTEVPDPATAKRVKKGEAQLARVYVEPKIKECGLKVFIGAVDAKDKETIPPTGVDMVAFPSQEGVEFTYRPADRDLFLGDAAKNVTVANKQIADNGGPEPQHEFGSIPVGLFSDAAADGAADCTFDMDLYFDDRNVPELAKQPAGEVKDGKRHWFHEWQAPYSGNHHFEMYRYRTCGGERELIDVAAIEAVLL